MQNSSWLQFQIPNSRLILIRNQNVASFSPTVAI